MIRSKYLFLLLVVFFVLINFTCHQNKPLANDFKKYENNEQQAIDTQSLDTVSLLNDVDTFKTLKSNYGNPLAKIMFYNCENLFDTEHDSLKNDNEFLPNGKKHWTVERYRKKINRIAKTIIALGKWKLPAVIGLCEIENRHTLLSLVHYSPLKKFNYQIIHKESPDKRGIDVGVLYRPKYFNVLDTVWYVVRFPFAKQSHTRDLLYIKGILKKLDTLHIFVNHWPSRWGGQKRTERKRIFVARLLRSKVDSIFQRNPEANILIMGDFNDSPEDVSLTKALKAKRSYTTNEDTVLFNLSYVLKIRGQGSYKYHGRWDMLDQIIVSGGLFHGRNRLLLTYDNVHVFKPDFLMEPDERYTGKKPFRTYVGYKYNNGFSDHLPVYAEIHQIH